MTRLHGAVGCACRCRVHETLGEAGHLGEPETGGAVPWSSVATSACVLPNGGLASMNGTRPRGVPRFRIWSAPLAPSIKSHRSRIRGEAIVPSGIAAGQSLRREIRLDELDEPFPGTLFTQVVFLADQQFRRTVANDVGRLLHAGPLAFRPGAPYMVADNSEHELDQVPGRVYVFPDFVESPGAGHRQRVDGRAGYALLQGNMDLGECNRCRIGVDLARKRYPDGRIGHTDACALKVGWCPHRLVRGRVERPAMAGGRLVRSRGFTPAQPELPGGLEVLWNTSLVG